jgi:hypothetical protein
MPPRRVLRDVVAEAEGRPLAVDLEERLHDVRVVAEHQVHVG